MKEGAIKEPDRDDISNITFVNQYNKVNLSYQDV